jgi:hypothetical protein
MGYLTPVYSRIVQTTLKAILQAAHLECILATLKYFFNELADKIRIYGAHMFLRDLRFPQIRFS